MTKLTNFSTETWSQVESVFSITHSLDFNFRHYIIITTKGQHSTCWYVIQRYSLLQMCHS